MSFVTNPLTVSLFVLFVGSVAAWYVTRLYYLKTRRDLEKTESDLQNAMTQFLDIRKGRHPITEEALSRALHSTDLPPDAIEQVKDAIDAAPDHSFSMDIVRAFLRSLQDHHGDVDKERLLNDVGRAAGSASIPSH